MMVDIFAPLSVRIGKVIVELAPHFFLCLVHAHVLLGGLSVRPRSVLLFDILVLSALAGSVLVRLQTVFEVMVSRRVFTSVDVLFVVVGRVEVAAGSYLLGLLLEEHHHRVSGVVEQALEVHSVVQLLLGVDGLVEAEVVVPLLQGVERDVPVELPEGMGL